MTSSSEGPDPAAALAQARRVHLACEQFETLWRQGHRPSLENALALAGSEDHEALFEELLALELELRRGRGEAPAQDDYLRRFPGFASVIAASFDDLSPRGHGYETTALWPPRNGLLNQPDAAFELDRPIRGIGDQLGDYVLLEEIARGGMGVVYKGRHAALKRVAAIKMILSGTMATPAERERFRREAEAAASLDHPNIVPIYEVREHDGMLYLSMKLIEGGSLADRKEDFRQNPQATARLIACMARAVQFAHDKGFIHCDLKPSNILIDQGGQPQITDFGLARRATGESSLTVSGAILGTPSYMAPEQASGRRGDVCPATDVYGLGAILYELLTGRPPFRTASLMETVVQVLERDPIPPRELAHGLPRELETICLKCLEKLPEERYASPRALAEDLDRFLEGEVVEATGAMQRLRRWNRREPEVVSRVVGLAIVALCTELNHWVFSPNPIPGVHYAVQGTLLCWGLSALLFQWLWKHGWRTDRVRLLWSVADVVCLTTALTLLDRLESPLLVGYPLLIAASGLWFRVNLVWFTTGLAIVGYLALYMAKAFDWEQPFPTWARRDLQYPNIYIAALVITGFVIARQVKRILAIGQYYELRQGE